MNKVKKLLTTFNVFIFSLISLILSSYVLALFLNCSSFLITFDTFSKSLFWIPSVLIAFCFVGIPLIWEFVIEHKPIFEADFFKLHWSFSELIYAIAVASMTYFWANLLAFLMQFSSQKIVYTGPEFLKWFFHLIVLAFSEEYLIRSFIQKRLREIFSPLFCILISGLIFSFGLHASEDIISNLLIRFPFGVILGFFYHRNENLFVPFASHFFYNLAFIARRV